MFKRELSNLLVQTMQKFTVMALTGPRQSGKTTLLRATFPEFSYVSLESPDQLLMAKSDPRGFLMRSSAGLIVDEAQNFPDLFSYIQEIVDIGPNRIKFILSGSQNFLLLEKISQTLAGRAVIFELLPLTFAELTSDHAIPSPSLYEFLYHGSYPRPYHEQLPTSIWFDSYIKTYLERDVRSMIQVRDLSQFRLFLKYCAGFHGQEFNSNLIATSLGMSQTNVMHWLSILEASYIVFRLQPYYKNYRKRLSKRSKLYFYDSAIVCHLLGIESPEHLVIHPAKGAIFEGFVISELIKTIFNQGKQPELYFWREHSGVEIDVLIEQNQRLIALEAKPGITLLPEHTAGLKKLEKTIQDIPVTLCLVNAGDQLLHFQNIEIMSWKNFAIKLLVAP